MNMQYEVVDDTVHIKDDKGNIREERYTSNIDDKLECENNIEILDNIRQELENMTNIEESSLSHLEIFTIACLEMETIVTTCNLSYKNLITAETFYKIILGSLPIVALLCAGEIAKTYYTNKKSVKEHRIYCQLIVIVVKMLADEEIRKASIELDALQEERRIIEGEIVNRKVKEETITVKQNMENYKKELVFYYQIALEEEKWAKYYRKNILESKARKREYDENQIKLIRNYCQRFSKNL